MERGRLSVIDALKYVLWVIFGLGVLFATPTGWVYDLWAGEGTQQGQRAAEETARILGQEDVEAFFLAQTPATVGDGELEACPLARLRDVEQEGVHYYRRGSGRRATYVSEYISADYPLSFGTRLFQTLVGGCFYNRYYLTRLADDTWLCIYFDDYMVLTGAAYPVGYVRYTTTQERRMLEEMAADYDLDSVYVLDMYRHGKAGWTGDVLLRFALLFVVVFIVVTVQGMWKKRTS